MCSIMAIAMFFTLNTILVLFQLFPAEAYRVTTDKPTNSPFNQQPNYPYFPSPPSQTQSGSPLTGYQAIYGPPRVSPWIGNNRPVPESARTPFQMPSRNGRPNSLQQPPFAPSWIQPSHPFGKPFGLPSGKFGDNGVKPHVLQPHPALLQPNFPAMPAPSDPLSCTFEPFDAPLGLPGPAVMPPSYVSPPNQPSNPEKSLVQPHFQNGPVLMDPPMFQPSPFDPSLAQPFAPNGLYPSDPLGCTFIPFNSPAVEKPRENLPKMFNSEDLVKKHGDEEAVKRARDVIGMINERVIDDLSKNENKASEIIEKARQNAEELARQGESMSYGPDATECLKAAEAERMKTVAANKKVNLECVNAVSEKSQKKLKEVHDATKKDIEAAKNSFEKHAKNLSKCVSSKKPCDEERMHLLAVEGEFDAVTALSEAKSKDEFNKIKEEIEKCDKATNDSFFALIPQMNNAMDACKQK